MNNNNFKSASMLAASMLIFGTIGIFRRYIPLPSAVLACFRGFAGTAFLLIVALIQKKTLHHNIGIRKILWLAATGALIGFNWILLFESYNYTTVAVATLCYYMQPTIVILLSPLLFSERITLKKGICTAAAIIGMLFVSGVAENGIPSAAEAKGILFGLGAATLYAAVVIMNKKLPGIDPYEKTVIQLSSAAIVLLPYIVITGQGFGTALTPTAVIMLLIVGFVHTGVAYALYFGSMDGLNAQSVAIFSYLDPISALILSALILHEQMSPLGAAGAVLIIGATLISEVSFNRTVRS